MNVFRVPSVYDAFREFDRFASELVRGLDAPALGPAYDLRRTGDHTFELAVALPGFEENELTLTLENRTLLIRGEPAKQADDVRFVYRGIGKPSFERRFALGEHVEVKGADLRNGVLHVALAREVPEALKPRQIEIGNGKPQQIEGHAA